MNERHEYRLERQVGPRRVERRGPHQHAARAHTPLEQCRLPIVEPRQRGTVGTGRHAAIAIEARRGEVARARAAEHLEQRMAVLERAEARRRTARAIDGRARHAGQDVRDRGPARPLTRDDEEAAAALHECLQPFGGRLRDRRVVEDDDRGRGEILAGQRVGLTDLGLDPRGLAHRDGTRQIQARIARRP